MVVEICPKCQSRYLRDTMNTDMIHQCTAEFSTALRDEDIKVIGNWEDYTGSGNEPSQVLMVRGQDTKLWGTRPWIEDVNRILPDFTVRGASKNIYRTRNHLEYIDKTKK